MDEEKRELITRLAKKSAVSKTRVDMLEQRNIYGLTMEEQQDAIVEYMLAKAEMVEDDKELYGVIHADKISRIEPN